MACAAPYSITTLLPSPATVSIRRPAAIRCGPRDNRQPLHRGRILSTEAIQVIQSLKRAYKPNEPTTDLPTHLLSRLIKSDLVAAMKELLRQERCFLATKAFSVLRSEYGADLSAYAEMVAALERNGLVEEIDPLICELEAGGGIQPGEEKGLLALVKAVIRAGRRESTVRIYQMMKRIEIKMDEYLGRVLSKGLRRFGEGGLADEVDRELGRMYKGIFIKSKD